MFQQTRMLFLKHLTPYLDKVDYLPQKPSKIIRIENKCHIYLKIYPLEKKILQYNTPFFKIEIITDIINFDFLLLKFYLFITLYLVKLD